MESPDTGAPADAPLRVLIADDHPAIVSAVSRFLSEEEGIDLVGRADDGAQALRLIEQRRPDVAVLDVRMPEAGGIDVLRRLGTAEGAPRVILFTGYPDRSLLLEALDIGARGFVLKESSLSDLTQAIRVVGRGETYVDPALAAALASPRVADRLHTLTRRQREIIRMLADGMRNEDVARRLSISPLTVKTHVKNAMERLEADTRTEAVATALREALIS